jgi:hypothetical protein
MAWQIATEFVFSGSRKNESPLSDLAGLYVQAKIERRQNNAMLRFSPAIVENQSDWTTGWDRNHCRHKFEFGGNDSDFGGLHLIQGQGLGDLLALRPRL